MEPKLKVWRLSPHGVRIVPAEKTLNDTANPAGIKWCVPYATANRLGWWVFPSVDIDITWKGEDKFEHVLHSPFPPTESILTRKLLNPHDAVDPEQWCPNAGGRSKFNWGGVEGNIVQIWTGVILQTPPGWCLHARSPVNCQRQPYSIQEGILETDWMQYDLWTNIVFHEKDVKVCLRKDQWPPLAHLIPIRRESFKEDWGLEEEMVNRDTPEANRVFEFWIDYNHKKYGQGGQQFASSTDPTITKDATTYHKERKRIVGSEMEPDPKVLAPKALPTKKKIKPFTRCPHHPM
jgi:hypothetical protein